MLLGMLSGHCSADRLVQCAAKPVLVLNPCCCHLLQRSADGRGPAACGLCRPGGHGQRCGVPPAWLLNSTAPGHLHNPFTGMAGNLQKYLAGPQSAFHPQLLVWNRTASKCEPLVRAGARQAASMAGAQVPRCTTHPQLAWPGYWPLTPASRAELAESCAIVFSCMVNDAALEATCGAYLDAPAHRPGAVYIDQSTVAPPLTTRLAERAEQQGIGEHTL